MALLHGGLLSRAAIAALRAAGYDYYLWKGKQVIRRWPRPPVQPHTPKQQAWMDAFASFVREYNALSIPARQQWKVLAASRHMTGRALFFKVRLSIWKARNPQWL